MINFSKFIIGNTSNITKLRHFSLKYRSQFGKGLQLTQKISKIWLKRKILTKNFLKLKKKLHYRVKRAVPIMRFYKSCLFYFKVFKIKSKLFWVGKFSELHLISNIFFLLKEKIRKKKQARFKNSKFTYLGQKKFLYFKFLKYIKKAKKLLKLKGKIILLNSWISSFHRRNLENLRKTLLIKAKKSFNKFKKKWTKILFKEKFIIYNWLSFFLFRVIFLEGKNLVNIYTSPYKKKLLVGISVLEVYNFIQIINTYINFINFIIYKIYILKATNLDNYLLFREHKYIVKNRKNRTKRLNSLISRKTKNIFFNIFNKLTEKDKNLFHYNRTLDKFLIRSKDSGYNSFINLFKNLLYKSKINLFFNINLLTKNSLSNTFINLYQFHLNKNKIMLESQILNNSIFLNSTKTQKNKLIFENYNLNFFSTVLFKLNLQRKYTIYYKHLYSWLFWTKAYNDVVYEKLFRPYNIWFFFLNYSINYYLFSKLYFVFFNYFFFIICQKFKQIQLILRLKGFELGYEFIKYKDNSRYYLGMKPQTFVTTFNRRLKKGLLFLKF